MTQLRRTRAHYNIDHPLIIMQLTSAVLPKLHTPKTVELFPKQPEATTQSPHLYCPQASLFQLRIDIPSTVTLNVEGTDVVWIITGTLQLMLLLNGLSPDDTSTVLKGIVAPRITKQYWPIPATSAPDGFQIFDFHVPLDVLSRFYEERDALSEMQVSLGLLHDSVKDNALIITHQPRFQKNAPKKKKMASNEIRDAIELNSSLRKKFSFIVPLKKYNIFCMVHEQMLIQPAVQEIENLGDMIVVSATTQHRITAREVSRTVAPPFVLVRFPPIYAIPDIIRSAATVGPVDSHQIFQQSGIFWLSISLHSLPLPHMAPRYPGRCILHPGLITIRLHPLPTDCSQFPQLTCRVPCSMKPTWLRSVVVSSPRSICQILCQVVMFHQCPPSSLTTVHGLLITV